MTSANPARPPSTSSASSASEGAPDVSRSGSSVMEATHLKLSRLKLRLEDEEATMHRQLRHFSHIKHAISRICQNDEEYLDNPDIIKANTVLEDRAVPNPTRKCYTAKDALALLKEGNAQFLRDEVAPKQSSQRHVALHFGQKPHAVIIACSDSRVPPEMIFNQGFGDLFVIRLAGNTVDALARASLLYAVLHLEAPLVVVLGHESCGAVTAALAPEDDKAGGGGTPTPGDIKALIKNIQKGLVTDKLAEGATEEERLMCAIVSNVFHVARSLEEHPDIKPLIQEGKLDVVGAYYGFHGVVSFFDDVENDSQGPSPRGALTPAGGSSGALCVTCGSGGGHAHAAAAAPAAAAPVLDRATHMNANGKEEA